MSTYPWISLTSEALTRKFLNNYFARSWSAVFAGYGACDDRPDLAGSPITILGIGFVPEEFAEEEKTGRKCI